MIKQKVMSKLLVQSDDYDIFNMMYDAGSEFLAGADAAGLGVKGRIDGRDEAGRLT